MRFWYQPGVILAPKIHKNRVLEALWVVLEASWGILGTSWRRLGTSWGVLAPLGAVLKTSWLAKRGPGGQESGFASDQRPVGPPAWSPPSQPTREVQQGFASRGNAKYQTINRQVTDK